MATRMEREGKEEKVGEVNPPELLPFCFKASSFQPSDLKTSDGFDEGCE